MKRSAVASLAILVVCVCGPALAAQAAQRGQVSKAAPQPKAAPSSALKPNFSGTWAVVSPDDEVGQVKEVQQTDATITIANPADPSAPLVYRLDGRGVREETKLVRTVVPTVSTAAWQGRTLVLTRETTLPDRGVQLTKQAWSLDTNGRLVIAITQSRGGQELLSRTFTYKKEK